MLPFSSGPVPGPGMGVHFKRAHAPKEREAPPPDPEVTLSRVELPPERDAEAEVPLFEDVGGEGVSSDSDAGEAEPAEVQAPVVHKRHTNQAEQVDKNLEKNAEKNAREEQAQQQGQQQLASQDREGGGRGGRRRSRQEQGQQQTGEAAEASGPHGENMAGASRSVGSKAQYVRGQEWLLTSPGFRNHQTREIREAEVGGFTPSKPSTPNAPPPREETRSEPQSGAQGQEDQQELGWQGQGKGGGRQRRRSSRVDGPDGQDELVEGPLDEVGGSSQAGLPGPIRFVVPQLLPPPSLPLPPSQAAPLPPPVKIAGPRLEDLRPELQETLRPMLEEGPAQGPLAHLLAQFGLGILQQCKKAGVRVTVLQSGTSGYQAEERRVLVSPADLASPTAVLESFSQAYDHALGGGRFASQSSLAVLANYESWRTQTQGQTSPQQFFARALAGYLEGEERAGAAMHAYVEYLVKQSRYADAH